MSENTTKKVASCEKVRLWDGTSENLVQVRSGYKISLNESFRDYVDETYESFLLLARSLAPATQQLTDHETVSQLQDLYFLLKEGVVRITEKTVDNGSYSLLLEIFET